MSPILPPVPAAAGRHPAAAGASLSVALVMKLSSLIYPGSSRTRAPTLPNAANPDPDAPPIQLPLFADVASFIRVRPEHNVHRFYH
jgi:hypothetical protein